MSSRRRLGILGSAAWLAALAVGAVSPAVATAEDAQATAGSAHEERALEVARRMADALRGANALRVSVEMAYDAVQPDGQSIEFGATRSLAIRRPDRARVDAVDRTGARRQMLFDGHQIALVDEARQVYALEPFAGELDGMLDHVQHKLDLPTPLAEFLATDLYELLAGSDSADWVDEQTIGGVACEHVAFRNAEKGLQLWVPRAGDPLPRRIVITYEQAAGRPQFRADLRDWEISPALDDALFAFTPAEGAERIYFRTGALLPAGAAGFPRQEEER